jgi:hypothetical protein
MVPSSSYPIGTTTIANAIKGLHGNQHPLPKTADSKKVLGVRQNRMASDSSTTRARGADGLFEAKTSSPGPGLPCMTPQ